MTSRNVISGDKKNSGKELYSNTVKQTRRVCGLAPCPVCILKAFNGFMSWAERYFREFPAGDMTSDEYETQHIWGKEMKGRSLDDTLLKSL